MVEFVLDEELKSWQTKAAEFARQELKPYAAEWDRTAGADPASAFPMEALKRCSRAGLRTVTVPKEMGGQGSASWATAFSSRSFSRVRRVSPR